MNPEKIGKILNKGLKREIASSGMRDRFVVVNNQLGIPLVVDITPIPRVK